MDINETDIKKIYTLAIKSHRENNLIAAEKLYNQVLNEPNRKFFGFNKRTEKIINKSFEKFVNKELRKIRIWV